MKLITSESTMSFLTYAGSIPFWFCALLLIIGIEPQNAGIDIQYLLSVYGLVISSFMAGTLWGQQVNKNNGWQRYLLFCSNGIALGLWVAFLTLSFTSLMIAYVVAFLVLLLIDYQLSQSGISNKVYFKLRLRVTFIVVLAIGVSALAG